MEKRWLGKKLRSVKLSVLTATRSEATRGNRKMSLEEQIEQVLFNLGKEIKILQIDNDNMILSINYEKYIAELKSILEGYITTPEL